MSVPVLRTILETRGFITKEKYASFDLLAESNRVFVAIKKFDSIATMLDRWDSVQAHLATEFYTEDRLQSEKLWDSYLVLICPGLADVDRDLVRRIEVIMGDLAYCRKLLLDTRVADQPQLAARYLSPLFPIHAVTEVDHLDPLTVLKNRLRKKRVPEDLISLLDETDPDKLIDRAKAGGTL